MSPELNGNPPIVTKRKKHLEKKHSSTSLINETTNMNMFTFAQQGNSSNSLGNPMYDQPPTLYPVINYPILHEPMSLPLYGATSAFRNVSSTNPFAHNMHQQHLNPNVQKMPPLFVDSNECKSLPIFDQTEDVLKRRFSDPGLPNDSDSSLNSYECKLIQKLTQQIQGLKESNRKLSRDLTELRLEMNMMKQQMHSRHYEREYEPGMLADIIREVRDAARVREDALLSRVKHMIEEKQMTINQINHLSEKNRHNDRLAKLEDQMKSFSVNNSSRSEDNIFLPTSSTAAMEDNTSAARQVLELERETLLLRRELQDARAKKDESDHKILQLDKQLFAFLRGVGPNAVDKVSYDASSDDSKSASIHSDLHNAAVTHIAQQSSSSSTSPTVTLSTSVSSIPQISLNSSPQRITLSGPVTNL